MNVFFALASVIVATACSKSAPPSQAAPPASRNELGLASGVDPRDPEQVLPIAPVVAPLRLPVTSAVGSAVTTVFQARPNTSCQMQVDYPSGRLHQQLPPKVTDDAGRVSWTWVPLERGRVVTRIVCSGGQMTQATIRVV